MNRFSLLRPLFSGAYWRYAFSFKRSANALLAAFGTLWLVVEIVSFFSEKAADHIRPYWWVFLILGIFYAALENRPKHRIEYRLRERDVTIGVRVADMFSLPGALVVGTNTSFDTSPNIISPHSIQGIFTTKFYDKVEHLDRELEEALAGYPYTEAPAGKRGKQHIYKFGTCITLEPRGRKTYWVAIAAMNDHGVAKGTFEDVKWSLPCLWEFIASRGDCGSVVMPVLGSGFTRIPETREKIIREIVNSFVAACSSTKFCETLTIVIPIKDFYKYKVNLNELGEYIRHVCQYTDYKSSLDVGRGMAIS